MGRAMKLTAEQKIELAALIPRIKGGDPKAFETFIDITQKSVFRFCFFLSKNREQADEFCQETYLKAMDNFKNLENENASLDWLLTIAKNLFIDQFRSAKRKTELLEDNIFSHSPLSTPTETSFEIQEILSRFDIEDQSLLLLIDLEDYTYAEAAALLGTTEDAVRSRIHRLRQAFQKYLQKPETK